MAGAKRRRNRRDHLGAAAAALALVAVAAVWQGPNLVNRSTPPTSHDDSRQHMTTDAWVASLPRGDDVQAAYADGQTLHVGDSEVAITGDQTSARSSSIELARPADGRLAGPRESNVADEAEDSTDTSRSRRARRRVHAAHDQPKPFMMARGQPRWDDVRRR